MIPVSQPFLPPIDEYNLMISKLWETKWITNNGSLVQKLEAELERYLNVNSLFYVTNGTMALQLALKALDINNEVITTPFSFVATTTSILWQNCKPIFVDIDPITLCIDADKIEDAITEKTEAILATHVYGIPCDVEKIEQIALKHNLKVIYDAAHAFGVQYKGKSLLSYGDLSAVSFHATKLYHTVEGGAIVNNCGVDFEKKIKLLINFGFEGQTYYLAGTNAKNSEFHAAMGLCNLKYIDETITKRKMLTEQYNDLLDNLVKRPTIIDDVEYNYAYYPVIFETEEQLLRVKGKLEENKIMARRYFFPSLNNLPYLKGKHFFPISEDISSRILCLPLFHDLHVDIVELVSGIIRSEVRCVFTQMKNQKK